jgi:tetratricopeptide (TPR) repeat protein
MGRLSSRRTSSFALAALVGALGMACATYSDLNQRMRADLDHGDFDGAVSEANDLMKVKKAKQLPRKWKKDTGLAVLERATILHALGDYELSARDFSAAEEELEMLDISADAGGNIARWVYSESAAKYTQPPSERLALNAINLENYLMRGDLKGARVEAKRFTVMRNYLLDHDPDHAYGEFGSYMAGFVFEKLGNPDEAMRYYDEALSQRDFATLREPIARLSQSSSVHSERLDAYSAAGADGKPAPAPREKEDEGEEEEEEGEDAKADGDGEKGEGEKGDDEKGDDGEDGEDEVSEGETESGPDIQRPGDTRVSSRGVATSPEVIALATTGASASEGAGELLVVIKLGRVPYKEPVRIPIGAAIGIGAAYITGDTTLLKHGVLKFINYPELVPTPRLFDEASVHIDGRVLGVELASNLGKQVIREYEELKPRIIGAALTRMIARAATSAGIQAAGNAQSDSSGNAGGSVVGFLAALAVEGTMVALDKPDTRSWTTMPDRVYIARTWLPAGKHHIKIATVGGVQGARSIKEVDVEIPADGFAAIDFTTLR